MLSELRAALKGTTELRARVVVIETVDFRARLPDIWARWCAGLHLYNWEWIVDSFDPAREADDEVAGRARMWLMGATPDRMRAARGTGGVLDETA